MVLESYHAGLRQEGMFAIAFNSIELGLLKTFTLPDLEWEVQKFGSAGTYWDHKEAGRLVVGTWEVEKAVKADETDEWTWNTFFRVLGMPPVAYQNKEFVIYELTSDRKAHKRMWTLHNAWASKMPGLKFDGMSSNFVLEKLTGECDYVDFKNL
ncbi:MAG: hypothetical protein WCP22_07960 [Chlamydiota bacterium]